MGKKKIKLRQGSTGFPFPDKNGKEKVNFLPFSLPNGKSTLFPSHFPPLLIILNISFPFPSQINSTQHFLPISFPYQQYTKFPSHFLPIPKIISKNKEKNKKNAKLYKILNFYQFLARFGKFLTLFSIFSFLFLFFSEKNLLIPSHLPLIQKNSIFPSHFLPTLGKLISSFPFPS